MKENHRKMLDIKGIMEVYGLSRNKASSLMREYKEEINRKDSKISKYQFIETGERKKWANPIGFYYFMHYHDDLMDNVKRKRIEDFDCKKIANEMGY